MPSWRDLEWHNVRRKFHENRFIGEYNNGSDRHTKLANWILKELCCIIINV
jgi:hypothetical protein